MVIEVREGNRFSNFYHTYTTHGSGRHHVVKPGIPRHRGFADSIEAVVEQIVKAMKAHAKRQRVDLSIHTAVRIYRKRLYRKLLNMRPDELGLSHATYRPDPRLVRAELIRVENSPLLLAYHPLRNAGRSLPVKDDASSANSTEPPEWAVFHFIRS
jgi:hypothetical protein